MNRLGLPFLLITLAGAQAPSTPLTIVDAPERNRIRIVNPTREWVVLYYNYVASFGGLQMFQMRFRDRHGALVPITDAPGGWFTPHMRYASFQWPPRRRLGLRPRGSIELERDIASAVSWASWTSPVDGPCQVQLKLIAHPEPRGWRVVEALSDWHPGPCPGAAG